MSAEPTVVVTLRLAKSDYAALLNEAHEQRVGIGAYLRQLVFVGRKHGRLVDELLVALERDRALRLRLRALIANPSEG